MSNTDPGVPPQNQGVAAPLQGLFLDRPAHTIDPRGFAACNNVRIEFGRVNASLLGWDAASIAQLPGPCAYLTTFIDSRLNQLLIGVTPTDILFLSTNGTNIYMTPVRNQGYATVTNGSATVLGDIHTRWASDIQFGDHASSTGTVAEGSTKIYLANWDATGGNFGIPAGVAVFDTTNAEAIPPGTYLQAFGTDAGGPSILLSQATTAAIADTDVLQLGSGIVLRQNLRAGDQISFGSNVYNTVGGNWYTVQTVNSDTSLTLTAPYAGTSGTVSYTGRQLLTDTTTGPTPYLPECDSSNYPAAGGFNNTLSSTAGGDAWFFTNGLDPVVVYNTAYPTTALYARSVPFVCRAVRQSRGLMIYGGLQIPGSSFANGTSIASSDNGFPLQLAGGVSFQGIAADGPFNISRVSVLGSVIMLYCSGIWAGSSDTQDDSSGAVISASFVGFPTIWAFSDVIKTRGPVTGGVVTEFPDRHQFLSIDGMYRYNGLFIQVMNDHIWRSAMKNFDTTRPNAAFTFQVPTFGDLLWAYPQLTDPPGQFFANTAMCEAYMEQANSYLFKPYTQRDFPFTATTAYQNVTPATFGTLTQPFANYARTWFSFGIGGNQPQYLAGDALGNLWHLYGSNTQAGTPAVCTATWGSRLIGNARSRALVKRVYPAVEQVSPGPAVVSVTLKMQNTIGGPVLSTSTEPFDATYSNPDIYFTTHYHRGRVASVTISDDAGLGWVSDGYDLDWVPGGLR